MRVEFQESCQYSGFPDDGIYIGSGVNAVVRGNLNVSNNGGNGISVGQSSHLISGGIHGSATYDLSFKHIVPESLRLMNELLSKPSLEILREELASMLTEIESEAAKPRPDKLYAESIYIAVNNLLERAAQRVADSTDFTTLCSLAKRVYTVIRRGNEFTKDRKTFFNKREGIIYRKRLGLLDYFPETIGRNGLMHYLDSLNNQVV